MSVGKGLVAGVLLLGALTVHEQKKAYEVVVDSHASATTAVTFLRLENAKLKMHNDALQEALELRPRNLRVERDSMVVRSAIRLGVDPQLALAIAHVENGAADSTAVSSAGAVGIMQVMPPAALARRGDEAGAVSRERLIRNVCGDARLIVRQCNVDVGLIIFRDYLRVHQNEERALAAYNGALRYPSAADRYVSLVRDRQADIQPN